MRGQCSFPRSPSGECWSWHCQSPNWPPTAAREATRPSQGSPSRPEVNVIDSVVQVAGIHRVTDPPPWLHVGSVQAFQAYRLDWTDSSKCWEASPGQQLVLLIEARGPPPVRRLRSSKTGLSGSSLTSPSDTEQSSGGARISYPPLGPAHITQHEGFAKPPGPCVGPALSKCWLNKGPQKSQWDHQPVVTATELAIVLKNRWA